MQGVKVALAFGQAFVFVRVSCLTMCPTVFVCKLYSHYEQKAQVSDAGRVDMHDLPLALWCMLPEKGLM